MSELEFPKEFPQLETGRLVLRELAGGDSSALFLNYSDKDIAKNFLDAPLTDIEQAIQFLEAFKAEFRRGEAITWAVTLKSTDEFIGTCSYMIEANSCAEIGYDLSKAHWGKGLMSETLRAIIDYGFDELGLRKIKADTLSENTRSVKLLERLGFQLDEVREESHYFSLQSQNE
jgi:ribosomal-protein-alanine N-acetyltransferase